MPASAPAAILALPPLLAPAAPRSGETEAATESRGPPDCSATRCAQEPVYKVCGTWQPEQGSLQ